MLVPISYGRPKLIGTRIPKLTENGFMDDRVLIESFMHHRAQWYVDGLKFRKLLVTSSNSDLTTLLSSIASFIRYYFFLLCSSRNETVQTDVWRSQFPLENEFAEDIQFMNSYLDLNYLCIKKNPAFTFSKENFMITHWFCHHLKYLGMLKYSNIIFWWK